MNHIRPQELFYFPLNTLGPVLQSIKGIGGNTINTIMEERKYFATDIQYIINQLKLRLSYHTQGMNSKGLIKFSGIRDQTLMDLFSDKGFEVSDSSGCSQNTTILVVPNYSYDSTSVNRAFKYMNRRFNELPANRKQNINGLHGTYGIQMGKELKIKPYIMTLAEAYKWINNYTEGQEI